MSSSLTELAANKIKDIIKEQSAAERTDELRAPSRAAMQRIQLHARPHRRGQRRERRGTRLPRLKILSI